VPDPLLLVAYAFLTIGVVACLAYIASCFDEGKPRRSDQDRQ
jgi:hypothetical protein